MSIVFSCLLLLESMFIMSRHKKNNRKYFIEKTRGYNILQISHNTSSRVKTRGKIVKGKIRVSIICDIISYLKILILAYFYHILTLIAIHSCINSTRMLLIYDSAGLYTTVLLWNKFFQAEFSF